MQFIAEGACLAPNDLTATYLYVAAVTALVVIVATVVVP